MKKSCLKKLNTIMLAVLIFALAFSCMFSVPGVADALDDYNGILAESQWYYGSGYLNLSALKAEIAGWDLTKASTSSPVVIAVVDTGIVAAHPLFYNTNVLLKDGQGNVIGYNSYNALKENATAEQISEIYDETTKTHGTGVAGIMAILLNELGLTDYIKLLPVKASNSGTIPPTYTDSAANFPLTFEVRSVNQALKWLCEDESAPDVDVINMSFTAGSATNPNKPNEMNWTTAEVVNRFMAASEQSVVVAAAGNDNEASSNKPGYPASLDGVVSIMAYKTGAVKYPSSNYGSYDLIAPGENILTASGTSAYSTISGTSAAAAFASVTAALLRLKDSIDIAGTSEAPVSALRLASHMTNSPASTITYNANSVNYYLTKLDILEVLDASMSAYLAPSGIAVSDEGIFTSNEVKMIKDNVSAINLTARLKPYGMVDPALEKLIKWKLIKIGTRQLTDGEGNPLEGTEEYEESTVMLGSGTSLCYTPDAVGTYILRAEYEGSEAVFSEDRRFTLEYQKYDYIANSIKVVLLDELHSDKQTNNACVYAKDKLNFAVTYLEYIDRTEETKWYVNGEYAASGTTFEFSPATEGTYVISASYGDYSKIQKVFTVTAEKTSLRPENLAAIGIASGVVGLAIIVVSAFAVVATVKRKKVKESK